MLSAGFQFPRGLLSHCFLSSSSPQKRWTKASFNVYNQTDNPTKKITFSLQKKETSPHQVAKKGGVDL